MNSTKHPAPLAPWLEQAWLAHYLERKLGADECAWFEAYLLDRPALIEQLEIDSALRAVICADVDQGNALQVAAARSDSAGIGPEASTRSATPDRQRSATRSARGSRPRRLLRWASAASFVLGLGLGAVALQPWLASTGQGSQSGFAAAPSRLVFDALRGSYSEPRVDAGDPNAKVMIVDIAMPLGFRILEARVELADSVRPLPAAPISSEGFATYSLPSQWRGNARLQFELVGEAGEADRIDIRL